MGACVFETMQHELHVGDAFLAAVRDAQWEHGHGGYTGTIAEKHGYVLVDLPPRVTTTKVLNLLYTAVTPEAAALDERYRAEWGHTPSAAEKRQARAGRKAWDGLVEVFGERDALRVLELFNDKWGPAVAFPVRGKALTEYKEWNGIARLPRGCGVWLFCGWASS